MLKNKKMTPFIFALAIVAVFLAAPTSRAEEAAHEAGTVVGVLTAKGDNYIMVRPDGEHESRKYIPRWIGGMPKDGGKFDPAIMSAIREVAVNSRVKVNWVFEERLRVTAIEVLHLPGDGGAEDEPKPESGTFTGSVTAKGEGWISVRPDGLRESQKLMAQWIGGKPDGDGFQRELFA